MRSAFLNTLFGIFIAPNFGRPLFDPHHPETHWRLIRGWVLWSSFSVMASFSLVFFAFHDSVNWISSLSHKPLSWDFTNLWFGGKLALSGQLGVLFDVDAYRAAMRAAFSPAIANSEWSYPPSILLIGAPLALLPLPLAWAVWSLGGVAALAALVRSLGLPWFGIPALILSAAFADTFVLGQNGAYTAALLLGGLWLAPLRPGWAGLLFGLLACKPQFGVLVPICLIAGRHWRALFFSGFYAIGFASLAAGLFGPQVWLGFMDVTRPLMTSILEAPFLQDYQARAVTIFILVRGLGGDLVLAYSVQALAALVCAFCAYRLWSRPKIDPLLRLAATGGLTLLATPYGYSYDMVVLSVGILLAVARLGLSQTSGLSLLWAWPALCPFVTYWIGPYSSIIIALGTYQLMRFALASEGLGLAPAVAGYRTRDQLAPPSTVRIAPVV